MLDTEPSKQDGLTLGIGKEIDLIRKSRGLDDGIGLPEVVSESWQRCIEDYELAPDRVPRAEVLPYSQLHILLEEQEEFLRIAEPEVKRLFLRLVDSEYLVSLASREGAMLLFHCDYQYLGDLARSGVIPGSIWSEERQGTNGIGTCLRVKKPVAIVGNQHYGEAQQALTCLTAPVLGRQGITESVLNVTTARGGDVRMNKVVQSIVERTATRIENIYFSRVHRHAPMIRILNSVGHSDIADEGRLALDVNGRIIGGSSHVSKLLGLPFNDIVGASAEELLEFESTLSSIRPNQPVDLTFRGKLLRAVLSIPEEPDTHAQNNISRVASTSPSIKHSPMRIIKRRKQALRMDPVLAQEKDRAQRLLTSGLPLVITGEIGSGKTAFAQSLALDFCEEGGQVVSIDCTRITKSGGFNSLLRTFSNSQKSCLILDRIDELGADEQTIVLGLIENEWQSDDNHSGIVATSTADVNKLESDGVIRKDLLHRLKGGYVALAPLRGSPNLEGVIHDFFQIEREKLGRLTLEIDTSVQLILKNYHWPGNIRELRNTLRHAIALADRDEIRLEHLPNDIVNEFAQKDLSARSQSETSKIEAALRYNNGNVSLTARYLGISRATLYRKIQIKKAREES